MLTVRSGFIAFLAGICAVSSPSQDSAPASTPTAGPSQTVALTVPKGTPLQVALDQEVRVKKPGQPIRGRIVQPVYAFDRLVIPAGTEVEGQIAKIDSITGKKRVLGILNGDFTPSRKIDVEFSEMVLADGRHIPFHAVITPGSGQVMRFVTSKDEKKSTVKDAASEKAREAREEARRKWQDAMKQLKEPGKIHRLERYATNQLPVHPQYVAPGTLYFAELQEPLDFGSEALTPRQTASLGEPPPAGSIAHAVLITPLDSATTEKGEPVEAVLSQPLMDGDRLIFPEGSRLKGTVAEVRPASRFHHNGQLRIAFRELVPPDGVAQKVVAAMEGVEANSNDHVRLDSEGGAEATTSKTRYLSTSISLALAASSFKQHTDADDPGGSSGSNGVAGGAASFRLVGIAIGFFAKSQPVGMALGAYGASRSVYTNFISRGHDVVFPRNTAMEIGFGSRGKTVLPTPEQNNNPQPEPKHQ